MRKITRWFGGVAAAAAALASAGLAAAAPAGAATYHDTSVQVHHFSSTKVSGAADARNVNGNEVKVSGALVNTLEGVGGTTTPLVYTLASSPFIDGVHLALSTDGSAAAGGNVVIAGTGNPFSTSGTMEFGTVKLFATDSDGNRAVVSVPVQVGHSSVQLPAANANATDGGAATDTVALSTPTDDNTIGGIDFTTLPPGATVTESNLPHDLVSGNPLRKGDAAPGSYSGIGVKATDSAGAVANGTLSVKVNATKSAAPGGTLKGSRAVGDYVNTYGNGFDAYQQKIGAGLLVRGWTATKGDPATNLIRTDDGTKTNGFEDYQLEFQRTSGSSLIASGYCVAVSGSAIVQQSCSEGAPAQELYLDNGQLGSVSAPGMFVTPHGTGAALTVSANPGSGGGSGNTYRWKTTAQLP
jgi:hypothetical protein